MAASGATVVKGGRLALGGMIFVSVVTWVPCLYIWPCVVLVNGVVGWPIPVAYLAVVAGALLVCGYRTWRIAMRVGEDGLLVCNFWRTYRFGWAEVRRLVDGRGPGGGWALTVMLYDGRAVTASGTDSRPGHPRTLTALSQAAARHLAPSS